MWDHVKSSLSVNATQASITCTWQLEFFERDAYITNIHGFQRYTAPGALGLLQASFLASWGHYQENGEHERFLLFRLVARGMLGS